MISDPDFLICFDLSRVRRDISDESFNKRRLSDTICSYDTNLLATKYLHFIWEIDEKRITASDLQTSHAH